MIVGIADRERRETSKHTIRTDIASALYRYYMALLPNEKLLRIEA